MEVKFSKCREENLKENTREVGGIYLSERARGAEDFCSAASLFSESAVVVWMCVVKF